MLLGWLPALVASLMWTQPAAASEPNHPQPSSVEGDADPWWGRDKALHLGISAAVAATGYGVSSIWLDRAWQRASSGAALALTLGAGKELADWAGYGRPSYKDMLYDLAGTALGISLAYLIDLATETASKPERGQQQGLRQARPLLVF